MIFGKKHYSHFLDQTKSFIRFERKLLVFTAIFNMVALAGIFHLFTRSTKQSSFDMVSIWVLGFSAFFVMVALILCYVGLKSQKMWKESEKTSETDRLTGSMSQVCFEEMLDEEIRRAGRYHYPLTLCKLNLDDFDSIHDHFGQVKADEYLQNFSRLMQGTIRETDTLVRYAEDQFCVLLPHTDVVRSERFISRALDLVTDKADCTFSAGLTPYKAGETKSQFITRADSALQHAKKEGQKRICCVIGKDNHEMLVQF